MRAFYTISNKSFFDYVYQYKDHLGNIRVNYAYNEKEDAVEILTEHHYYPFGLEQGSYNLSRTAIKPRLVALDGRSEWRPKIEEIAALEYKYKYNGKELQDELGLGWYDYGARNYDPALGRWFNIDALSESYYEYSPYNYVLNSPLRFIDPNGMGVDDVITIMDNGTIERVETQDNFDIIQNESGSESITVAHNETGSQIGEVQTATGVDLAGESVSTDYFTVENKKTATTVFEFAASVNNNIEFSLDSFSFSDGFDTNAISLGKPPTGGSLGGSVSPVGQYGNVDIGGNHLIKNGVWTEGSHSHPGGGYTPSGFTAGRSIKPTMVVDNIGLPGDRGFMEGNGHRVPNKAYLYSSTRNGYTQYNSKQANYVGKKKQ